MPNSAAHIQSEPTASGQDFVHDTIHPAAPPPTRGCGAGPGTRARRQTTHCRRPRHRASRGPHRSKPRSPPPRRERPHEHQDSGLVPLKRGGDQADLPGHPEHRDHPRWQIRHRHPGMAPSGERLRRAVPQPTPTLTTRQSGLADRPLTQETLTRPEPPWGVPKILDSRLMREDQAHGTTITSEVQTAVQG